MCFFKNKIATRIYVAYTDLLLFLQTLTKLADVVCFFPKCFLNPVSFLSGSVEILPAIHFLSFTSLEVFRALDNVLRLCFCLSFQKPNLHGICLDLKFFPGLWKLDPFKNFDALSSSCLLFGFVMSSRLLSTSASESCNVHPRHFLFLQIWSLSGCQGCIFSSCTESVWAVCLLSGLMKNFCKGLNS